MRKFLSLILTLTMLTSFTPSASASLIIASGNCGTYNYDTQEYADNAKWTLDNNGTLTISGDGYIGGSWAYYQESETREKIKKLVVNDGIIGIGAQAFDNCENLAEMDITDDVKAIMSNAFYRTAWYENQNDGPVYIGNIFYMYKGAERTDGISENTTLTIREGTIYISGTLSQWVYFDMFGSVKNITNIVFPKSLCDIDARALDLTGWYSSQPDGVVYVNDLLYAYKGEMQEAQEISIKDGTTGICGYAFHSGNGYPICDKMTAVYFPTSLRNIGDCAFLECYSLTDLYYKGTEEQWNNTNIVAINSDHGNDVIFNVNVHFLGAVTPTPKILNTSTVQKNNGSYSVIAKIQDVPYDCELTVALYNDNKLVGIKTVPIVSVDTEKIIDISASSADAAKIFIWNSLSGMKPLCEAKDIDL